MFDKRNIQIGDIKVGETEAGTPLWFSVDSADLISKLLASRPSEEEDVD